MNSKENVIAHTIKWISDVVVGCNFCPFAAREIKRNSIAYEVFFSGGITECLQALLNAFHKLDQETEVETLFIIMPGSFSSFGSYLQLVERSEKLLKDKGYEGIYQIASFHPLYLFEGAGQDDPANYTNRSPYPMLHLLREQSVTKAIETYPGTEKIPQKNIEYARARGLAYMKKLQESCVTG